jgi:NAD(P)-dependent dehydrogenase (short-subunit alcohol dehydrogenase family)
MDVLVTGGDTELGRTIAEGFRDAGHTVVISGARSDELEVAAKELEIDAIVCDPTTPSALTEARSEFPHHLDTIVNVPAPTWFGGDPRTFTLSDSANAWRSALDATVISAVLLIQNIGDHLRSGGSIINVVTENPREGTAAAAAKAALADWTAGQATYFGTRGITINTVAFGQNASASYDGLTTTSPAPAGELTKLALFLTTSSARHITGQTLHVGRGALANFG